MVQTKDPDTTARPRRKRWVIPIAIVGVLIFGVIAGLFWFFGGEAPPEVDLAATASSVASAQGGSTAVDSAVDEGSSSSAGVDGTWSVDTSVGTFSLEDTTTSAYVGFRVEEVLNSVGSTTAVGRTAEVSGTIEIDGTMLVSAEVSADLTAIVSDESRREDSIQRALGTSSHPTATFLLAEPIELGEQAAEGEIISVTATGDLTVNGVTNQVNLDLEAQLIDGMILVTGTTQIEFADYDVSAPTSPAVLSVEDNGIVEIQLWLSR